MLMVWIVEVRTCMVMAVTHDWKDEQGEVDVGPLGMKSGGRRGMLLMSGRSGESKGSS